MIFFSYLNTCDLNITFHFSIHRLLNCNLGHSKILFGSIASYSYHFPLSVSNWYRNLYRPILIPIRHFPYQQKRYIGRYRYCIGRTLTLMCALNLNHKSVHICSCSLRTIAFWADLNYLRFSNAASLEEQERLLCYAMLEGEEKKNRNQIIWLLDF